MQDTAKYLVHANITADGVVERSDVVGAIFGQTEGLLGEELDLRDLQDSSKVGRIDVEVDSENGQSFGSLTIATSLDKVETAILAAALETIDRVGPCRSTIEVERIEDVRAAKRREIVERAKTLLAESFDGAVLSSQELIDEVRRSVRIEDITDYRGYPAGPRVADSDAIIVVEGRSDVLQLLQFGVKNAVAVEGTNVPSAIAELTRERTVTAFLDGDRGGELILKELAQVGAVDYVAFAPEGQSVEDLERHEVMAALREKVPYESVADATSPSEVAATDGSARPAPTGESTDAPADSESPAPDADSTTTPDEGMDRDGNDAAPGTEVAVGQGALEPAVRPVGSDEAADWAALGPDDARDADSPSDISTGTTPDEPDAETDEPATDAPGAATDADASTTAAPETLRGHARVVVGGESGRARLLDTGCRTVAEGDADGAFDLVRAAEDVPWALVLDGEVSQRVLDVCAQRGVEHVVAAREGEFVKRPTGVRVRTADRLLA